VPATGPDLALAGLESPVRLVDDVHTAPAPNHTAIPVAFFGAFE